jgi:DNA-binding GntR family transcriptional regulator
MSPPAALPDVPSPTKAELALRALRDAIQNGQLPPGTRLILQDIAVQMGMSYTPVREALFHLQSEGLVTYRPHYGTVVADPSREQAEEIYRLRLLLEPFAGMLAATNVTDEELSQIEAAHDALIEAVHREDLDKVPPLNAELHKRITAASGSALLTELVERLWNGVPYQAISLRNRIPLSAEEHEEILEALRRQDPDATKRALEEHIRHGSEAALKTLS